MEIELPSIDEQYHRTILSVSQTDPAKSVTFCIVSFKYTSD